MSRAGALYERIYARICGAHPAIRPWHFQWLAVKDIYADLRRILPNLKGAVLDVGCGDKPYEAWVGGATRYVGIDVYPGTSVDIVIEPGKPWPLEDASFDAILCTQVLEHVVDIEHVLSEMTRVLRPGGTLVVTVPFAYNEHGSPHDYRRFSVHGVRQIVAPHFDVVELKAQGRAGSTLGTLWLNWIDSVMSVNSVTRTLKGLLLPVWIVYCGAVNLFCLGINRLDATGYFYANVLLVATKRQAPHTTIRRSEK